MRYRVTCNVQCPTRLERSGRRWVGPAVGHPATGTASTTGFSCECRPRAASRCRSRTASGLVTIPRLAGCLLKCCRGRRPEQPRTPAPGGAGLMVPGRLGRGGLESVMTEHALRPRAGRLPDEGRPGLPRDPVRAYEYSLELRTHLVDARGDHGARTRWARLPCRDLLGPAAARSLTHRWARRYRDGFERSEEHRTGHLPTPTSSGPCRTTPPQRVLRAARAVVGQDRGAHRADGRWYTKQLAPERLA